MPTVFLESQHCGTPFLASNIAGCGEAASYGITGYLVPFESANDWFLEFMKKLEKMGYKKMYIKADRVVSEKLDAQLLEIKIFDCLIWELENNKLGIGHVVFD